VGWLAGWHYANLTYKPDLAQALRSWLIQNTRTKLLWGQRDELTDKPCNR